MKLTRSRPMRGSFAAQARPAVAASLGICSLAFCGLAACSPHPARLSPTQQASALVRAENALLIQAREPRSIVYRAERVVQHPDGPAVCGEFDGRNSAGVMAGYSRFIFRGQTLELDKDADRFEADWRSVCGEE